MSTGEKVASAEMENGDAWRFQLFQLSREQFAKLKFPFYGVLLRHEKKSKPKLILFRPKWKRARVENSKFQHPWARVESIRCNLKSLLTSADGKISSREKAPSLMACD